MAIYLFPLWALIVSIFAYLFPQWLVELKSIIVPLLVLVMLAMGLTLKWRDFTEVLAYRHIVKRFSSSLLSPHRCSLSSRL